MKRAETQAEGMKPPVIEWDDGYPTDESVAATEAFWRGPLSPDEIKQIDSWLRDTLSECAEHCCASYGEEPATDIMGRQVTHVHFSTGGWSGAETIMALIRGNWLLDYRTLQWRRGGHYILEFANAEPKA